ncbi:unnamed protein product [Lepeophtheirus salmonis]|uniref:(salmon louse) hypothetical protein n=1 Tax=Lepeophtheirus salmonis TaxID=72036 RepID=A0A7R8H266_LEPSM|nr:unnamed protein product [Lepeophtheirus salmonis]CAF2823648.1 unnamed protein product [Lepeophtheirus salmonis]
MPEDSHRTPMAWQHRNQINSNGYNSSSMEMGRKDPRGPSKYGTNSHHHPHQSTNGTNIHAHHGHHPLSPPTPNSNRYAKAPNTPSSAHSRNTMRNDGRRDLRESSTDRYSHDGRSSNKTAQRNPHHHHQSGFRNHRSEGGGSAGGGKASYLRSHHSPSSTDDTVEETTETESQVNDIARSTSEYGRQPPVVHGYPYPVAYQTPPIMAPANPFVGQQLMMAPNGSIRSNPCPVHHSNVAMPLAALYGMGQHHPRLGHSSVPPSVISGPPTTVRRARSIAEMSAITNRLDSKSFHGSMNLNPRIVLAENGAPSTLPVREAAKMRNGTLTRSTVGVPDKTKLFI